jgi:hypothetical protein
MNKRIRSFQLEGLFVSGVFASNGNFVCSMDNNIVAVMTVNGKVVAKSLFEKENICKGRLHRAATANGDIILAAVSAMFKSLDNGQTWRQVLKSSNSA